ncbi:Cyclic nucleotide-binding domain-containing protein 1 [Borealophlyctis nickersoniae]|nr:Cyclic nucleotide-binding domain-containing protein 1 [Borealophlyctis nickersoniae]
MTSTARQPTPPRLSAYRYSLLRPEAAIAHAAEAASLMARNPRRSSENILNDTFKYVKQRTGSAAYRALAARDQKLIEERKQVIERLKVNMMGTAVAAQDAVSGGPDSSHDSQEPARLAPSMLSTSLPLGNSPSGTRRIWEEDEPEEDTESAMRLQPTMTFSRRTSRVFSHSMSGVLGGPVEGGPLFEEQQGVEENDAPNSTVLERAKMSEEKPSVRRASLSVRPGGSKSFSQSKSFAKVVGEDDDASVTNILGAEFAREDPILSQQGSIPGKSSTTRRASIAFSEHRPSIVAPGNGAENTGSRRTSITRRPSFSRHSSMDAAGIAATLTGIPPQQPDSGARLSVTRRPSFSRRASMDAAGIAATLTGNPPQQPDSATRLSVTRRPSFSRRASMDAAGIASTLTGIPTQQPRIGRRRSSVGMTFVTAVPESADARHLPPPARDTNRAYQRFRTAARKVAHAVHLIKFLTRILKNPIEWSWEYDPKVYEEEAAEAAVGSVPGAGSVGGGTPGLMNCAEFFGVQKLFAKPKHFNGWLEWDMRKLFRKPPQERTRSDIDRMHMWCSTMEGMQKWHPALQPNHSTQKTYPLQRKLLQKARYERWSVGRLLIRESHPPHKFYILLDGEVEETKIDRAQIIAARKKSIALAAYSRRRSTMASVGTAGGWGSHRPSFAPSRASIMGSGESLGEFNVAAREAKLQELVAAAEARKMASSKRVRIGGEVPGVRFSRWTDEDESEDEEDEEEMDEENHDMIANLDHEYLAAYNTVLRRISAGDCFGETAILEKVARSSSIVTRRLSEFLVIDKDDFAHIVRGFKDEDAINKDEMLRTMPVFRTLGEKSVLAQSCTMRKFPVNKPVVIEGERCENIFFIRTGTCRVVKLVDFVKQRLGPKSFLLLPLSSFPQSSKRHHTSSANPASRTSLALMGTTHSPEGTPTTEPSTDPFTSTTTQLPPNCTIISKLLVIGHLGPGDHFGQGTLRITSSDTPSVPPVTLLQPPTEATTLGTGPSAVSIICDTRVECLSLSKIDLHRLGTDETWACLASSGASATRYAGVEEVTERYMEKRQWRAFKRRILGEVLGRKGVERARGNAAAVDVFR